MTPNLFQQYHNTLYTYIWQTYITSPVYFSSVQLPCIW